MPLNGQYWVLCEINYLNFSMHDDSDYYSSLFKSCSIFLEEVKFTESEMLEFIAGKVVQTEEKLLKLLNNLRIKEEPSCQ